MSRSYVWLSTLFDSESELEVAAAFQDASKDISRPPEADAAFIAWRSSNLTREMFLGEFMSAFRIPGFQKLGEQFMLVGGQFEHLADEFHTHEFILLSRLAPGALLWYGLGEGLAAELPGFMGNLFVRAADVASTRARTTAVFAKADYTLALERLGRVVPKGDLVLANPMTVFSGIPSTLAEAERRGMGCVCLGFEAP